MIIWEMELSFPKVKTSYTYSKKNFVLFYEGNCGDLTLNKFSIFF